ncbi:carbamoyltransferase [Cylindrospermopsis raciborskii]|uniref:NodU/CmcH-related carbamoyltransferase n=1 Tax=Cylindrospermopsis raciborskii T3 TaxID=398006 RepID=B3EYG4_9CYAN|nr:carbamoyltransferase [Cylindrospermopsis raciborskii]ABI75099.1 NodU/CmcH-related carbamoyltransferase [Cylindrospermopsis raciborskii T3]EFA72776.1 sxtI (Putative carbamoyltransferase) [Raphidiopsis brookii D9]QKS73459.1 O-carbamoyltransferase [Cylindrospermopsis raciborskii CHAB3409]ACC69003.1 O-carbamoyltransferase [Cylindrospermopsis raciborskii T3]MCZ2206693.1 carbamoyltransferase [Cylindrospermopsis raciborskii PAMP2011]
MQILGISAYYHDSAAAMVIDGEIVAAAQEERFSRRKHDAGFPTGAITYCLKQVGTKLQYIDQIVFYDKPLVKFERLLETYLAYAPKGFGSFITAMPVWLKEKLYLKTLLKKELALLGECKASQLPPLLFTSHHQAHAAAAFFPSPFQRAAVLCLDGVGEWATTSVWLGEGNKLTPQWEIDFPHSLGLLYSAFTYYTGFKVNSGEYKLMGLAPYGEPKYVDQILKHLLDLKEDGTFRLNMDYFNYTVGLTMTNHKFHSMFGGPPRQAEGKISQRDMDLASSIQKVTEEVILRLARTIKKELGVEYLCLAGGVGLNCVANGRILRESDFKDIWIQPAAGDAGSAVGAALAIWHEYHKKPRTSTAGDRMKGSYLGPSFSEAEILQFLNSVNIPYHRCVDNELMARLAEILDQGNVVGWFSGRMEFGPRALGGRSIIGDSRSPKMQSVMNLKIKYRESFRPFAPSVLAERVSDYFDLDRPSPYMLLVAQVKENLHIPMTQEQHELFGIEKLNVPRSQIPAVTHVDYSARIQTVHKETNPRYYELIRHFEARTGCAVLVNTSFNVRGEPIVCTPEDAYRCFMRTEMDYLVMENFLLVKSEQPRGNSDESWQKEFELD